MAFKPSRTRVATLAALCSLVAVVLGTAASAADGPSMVDSRLGVRTVVTGLNSPTNLAFIGPAQHDLLRPRNSRHHSRHQGKSRRKAYSLVRLHFPSSLTPSATRPGG